MTTPPTSNANAMAEDGSSSRRGLTALKPHQWPPAYRDALTLALRKGTPFVPGGLAAGWRPASLEMRLNGFGLRLAWESRVGLLNPESKPCDSVTPESVDTWIDYLMAAKNSFATVVTRLDQLYAMTCSMAPQGNWRFMLPARDWFKAEAVASSAKALKIVHPAELYGLGWELMGEAASSQGLSRRAAALAHRDGLMISMLAAAPVRRSNFTAIEIGRHIIRIGDEYWLIFEPSETKGGKVSRKPLPQDLTPAIERYFEHHRRDLQDRARQFGHFSDTQRMWLGDDGVPLTSGGFYQIIMSRTHARFGHGVNPHLFRHSAQTAWAMDDPATSQGGKDLLDHASFKTTRDAYELGTGLAAAARYQQMISRRRGKG